MTMSLQEFLVFSKNTLSKGELKARKPDNRYYGYAEYDPEKSPEERAKEIKKEGSRWGWTRNETGEDSEAPYIAVSWRTGGISGGSCWDTGESNHYATSGDPPEELEALDTILEKCKSDIGFLQYKKLCSAVVEVETYSENEYYGNSTDYMAKYVSLPKLYTYLLEKGWLPT